MRKAFKYMFLAGIAGMFVSCVDDSRLDGAERENDGLYLTMSLSIPEMRTTGTRGVLDDPELYPTKELSADYVEGLSFYMFIFEDAHSPASNYLRTLVHGEDIKPLDKNGDRYTSTDDIHYGQILYSYKVKVDGTSENAIIHLVATADPDFETQLQNTTDRSELGLFYGASGLCTSGQYPAFWKRIELGMPIKSENKRSIEQKLSHVQMIRNFCRVTVRTNDQSEHLNGFTLMGYTLVNQVDHGYVAAYSDNDPRGFVEFEAKNVSTGELSGEMKSYADIYKSDNYIPSRHPLSVREHKEETSDWLRVNESDIFSDSPKYMFERPYQSQHRTFVLLKGAFVQNGVTGEPRYIKLDIGDIPEWYVDPEKGFMLSSAFEYKHLYRNFSYDIVIHTVASNAVGAATASAALAGPATNNVGASVETQPVKRIYDGVDEMWVNRTKFVIVDDDSGNANPDSFNLMWQYLSNLDKTSETNESQYVRYNYPGMELASDDESGIFDIVTPLSVEGLVASDNGKPCRGVNITFKKPGDDVRQKTVRLYYSNPSSDKPNVRLSRDVTFVMRKRWEFVNESVKEADGSTKEYDLDVEIYPGAYSFFDDNSIDPPYETLKEMRENIPSGYVGSQVGAQLTVMFELPDDLPEAIFPLDFKIGSNRQNIENAYAGNATVVTGPSLFEGQENFDGDISARMQFVKTVTWDDYHGTGDADSKGHRLVCVRFVTTNDVLAESGFDGTTSTTRIRVKNEYFKSGGKKDDGGNRIYGEGKFERASYDEAIDPTRSRYYWNFSYPEWTIYSSTFGSHPDTDNIYHEFTTIFDKPNDTPEDRNEKWARWASTHNNPHTLNNLYFAGYIFGTQDNVTNVPGTYMQVVADGNNHGVARSAENPEIWFNMNHVSSTGLNVSVVIEATNNSNRTGSSGSWRFYDRDVTVMIETTTETGEKKPYFNTRRTSTPSSSGNNSSKLDMNKLEYPLFEIPANETINRVLIWSVQADCHKTNGSLDIPGETRYYSIKLEVSPK